MNKISERDTVWDQSDIVIVRAFRCEIHHRCRPIGQPENLKEYLDTPTNQMVPAVVQREVQDVLAVVQRKVGLIDQDISQSQDLCDLRPRPGRREQYVALIDRLKTIIAPHKILQAELLADIFHLTLPERFQVHVPGGLFYPDSNRICLAVIIRPYMLIVAPSSSD